MSLHLPVLALVIDAALGAWLGMMGFFSFVGAPRAFAVYTDGGRYVNDVFPRYYRVGVGLGVVAFGGGLVLGYLEGFGPLTLAILSSTAFAVVLASYSVGSLVPKMEAAGEEGFRRYHQRSVFVNGMMLLSVAIALVASHVPA